MYKGQSELIPLHLEEDGESSAIIVEGKDFYVWKNMKIFGDLNFNRINMLLCM